MIASPALELEDIACMDDTNRTVRHPQQQRPIGIQAIIAPLTVFAIGQTGGEQRAWRVRPRHPGFAPGGKALRPPAGAFLFPRSEERRVGKECVSTCRSRRWPSHSTQKNTN